MITIQRFKVEDWEAVWKIIEPVFRAGETYAYDTNISEKDAYITWVKTPLDTYVAVDDDGTILGTYYIKENYHGPGAHVCNCGYIVAAEARGHGVASKMCEHSQKEAITKGFLAMQFNMVVSTNEAAVHVWKKNGFEIIGTIPKAYKHKKFGYVDTYVMYKRLSELN